MTVAEKLDRAYEYQEHERQFEGDVAPDGCYYCGGSHPSDCCRQPERKEFYRDIRGANHPLN